MCSRDEQTATENLEGGGIHPPFYIQGFNFIHKIEGKIGNDFGRQWTINFYSFLLYPGPGMEKSAESEACGGRKTDH